MAKAPKVTSIKTGVKKLTCKKYEYEDRTNYKFYYKYPDGTSQTKRFDDYEEGRAWMMASCVGKQQRDAVITHKVSTDIADILENQYLPSRTVGEKHTNTYRGYVKRLADAGITDFEQPNIRTLLVDYAQNMKACRNGQITATPASRGTVKHVRNMLIALWRHRFGYVRGQLEDRDNNPALAMPLPEGVEKPKEVFTWNEMKMIVSDKARWQKDWERQKTHHALDMLGWDKKEEVAKARGIHLASVYNHINRKPREHEQWLYGVLGVYTGMRLGTIMKMRWEWIDWQTRVMRIPGSAMKMSRSISIYLMDDLHTILLDRKKDEGLILDHPKMPKEENQCAAFITYLKAIGVNRKHFSSHCMRHNLAAWFTAMGMDAATIELMLGHEDRNMSKHYRKLAVYCKQQVKDLGLYGKDEIHLRFKPAMEDKVVIEFTEADS